jgi:phenylalanyl-tRNA synthetase beta subunit
MKCKNYYIIKISTYHSTTKFDDVFYDRVKTISKMKWDFIEKFSGFSQEYWNIEYMLDSLSCGLEKIYDDFKVRMINGEGYIKFWIPKERKDIYEWFKSYDIDFKVLKKTNIPINIINSTYMRERSREFTLKSVVYKHLKRKEKLKELMK